MKRLYVLIIPAILSSCLGFTELPVEYDYSYKGNFKRYRTFSLMTLTGSDTVYANDIIEKSIISRMKFLGYRQTNNKPQLLICYKMFPDSLNFNGYDQPDIEQWVATQDENLNYDRKKINMKTGTLLIQLFDRKQNRSIWQGYSTSLYGSIDFSDNRNLRNAVVSILDKYRFWAEGFMEAQIQAQKEFNN